MISEALETALADVKLEKRDAAAVALARAYAQVIDGGEVLKAGPPLLATLTALRMTPASRSAAVEGGALDAPDELDELEQRRAARAAGQHDS